MNELKDQLYMLEHWGDAPKVENVERTLAQLPLIERSCLLLAAEGFPSEEIADILDIDVERSIEATQYGRKEFLRIYEALISMQINDEMSGVHGPELVDLLIRSLVDAEASSDSEHPSSLQEEDDESQQGEGNGEDQPLATEQKDDDQNQISLSDNSSEAFFLREAPEPQTSPLGTPWEREDDENQQTFSESSLEIFCRLWVPRRMTSPLDLLNSPLKQRIGSYCIQGIVGTGKSGTVYQALHVLLGTSAAVKVLNVRLADENVAQFYKEASLLTRLENPHIIRVFDYGIEDGNPYLVMDYAPGGSLHKRYPKGTRLPLSRVITYVKQVAEALQYVHDRGWVHQDIKPENLLLGADDSLLLSDFGIAAAIPRKYTMTSAVPWELWNSTEYIAPEQFSGRSSPASDQYALGVIVYEWLTGRPIFNSKAAEQPGVVFTSLKQVVSELPPDVDLVVSRALQQEPARRYQSVSDFAADLERASRPKKPLTEALEQKNAAGSRPQL